MGEVRVADPRWTLTWCRGPDAVSFLQGLLSADLQREPGTVARSFLLHPQGKVIALLWALIGEDEVGLVLDEGVADEAIGALGRYRIRVKAEFEADDRPLRLHLGADVPAGGGWVRDGDTVRVDVASGGVPRTLVVGGDDPVDMEAAEWEACRIRHGEPVSGVDIGEQTIPQETGLVPEAVSFTKGCYLGQELVARIDTRGRVNQRLMVVTASGPVAAGDVVVAADREAEVTSAARSGDEWVGLATVRREVEDGEVVVVRTRAGDVTATVREP